VTPVGGRSLKVNLPGIGAPSKSTWRTVMACAGIRSTRKKGRRGGEGLQQKSSRQARTLRPRAHATRYENLHFYVTKAALSLLVEIADSSSPRLSEVATRIRSFSVVRKTRTVILNSLGHSERDSDNTKQAWRSAKRKTIYRRFQASLCENLCSNSLSTESRAQNLRSQVTPSPILQSINWNESPLLLSK